MLRRRRKLSSDNKRTKGHGNDDEDVTPASLVPDLSEEKKGGDGESSGSADEAATAKPVEHRDEYQVELDVNRSFVTLHDGELF